jgi:hypothetical protein
MDMVGGCGVEVVVVVVLVVVEEGRVRRVL